MLLERVVHIRGRDILDRQLKANGASKTEHVLMLALNPIQEKMYQALLDVRGKGGGGGRGGIGGDRTGGYKRGEPRLF
jgi:hypothetical protein